MQHFWIKDLVELAEYEAQFAANNPWYQRYQGRSPQKLEALGTHVVGKPMKVGGETGYRAHTGGNLHHAAKALEMLAAIGNDAAVRQVARIGAAYSDRFLDKAIEILEQNGSDAALKERVLLLPPGPAKAFEIIQNIRTPWALETMAEAAAQEKSIAPQVCNILDQNAEPVLLGRIAPFLGTIACQNEALAPLAINLLAKAQTGPAISEMVKVGMHSSTLAAIAIPVLQQQDRALLKKAEKSIVKMGEHHKEIAPLAVTLMSGRYNERLYANADLGPEAGIQAIAKTEIKDYARADQVLALALKNPDCAPAAIDALRDSKYGASIRRIREIGWRYAKQKHPLIPSLAFNAMVALHETPPPVRTTNPQERLSFIEGLADLTAYMREPEFLTHNLVVCSDEDRASLRNMFNTIDRLHLLGETSLTQMFDEVAARVSAPEEKPSVTSKPHP